MPYGIIKVDTVTFTDNGVDKNVSLSGLVQNPTFTGNVTATGTISGDVIRGGTTVSGATVTGTTANFVSGVFTTQVSGVTITGTTVAATTGNFTSLTGTTATFTSGIIASGIGALTFNGQADLRFADADSSHYIALQAPATITSNVTLTLPAADGTNGQVLTTNGTGTLSFTTAAGGATDKIEEGNTSAEVIDTGSDGRFVVTTEGSERLRITAAGLVGIGSSSPLVPLHVETTTDGPQTLVFLSNLSTGGTNETAALAFAIKGTAGTGLCKIIAGKDSDFSTNANIDSHLAFTTTLNDTEGERLRITSAGLVGIGITGPEAPLDVRKSASNAGLTEIMRLGGNAAAANDGYKLSFFQTGASEVAYLASYYTGGVVWNAVLNSTHNIEFRSGNTERARIDSSGRLLVGTSTSDAQRTASVQIASASGQSGWGSSLNLTEFGASYNPYLLLQRSRNGTIGSHTVLQSGDLIGGIQFNGSDGDSFESAATINVFVDGTPGNNDMPGRLVFSTTADGSASPTERMRITSGGNTLFGCTSAPSSSVRGIQVPDSLSSNSFIVSAGTTTTTFNMMLFFNGNGSIGSITTNASATAYNTSSDYRLKENITAVTDGITRLQQLKPSRFNFIADPDTVIDGFIAHEVQTIVPEAITGEKDEVDEDGNPKYQGIDQSKLVPLLTAALQEAIGEIESLKARLTAAGI